MPLPARFAFLAGALAAATALAQSPLTISETVEVRLVNLDLLATDRSGASVDDLRVEDLKLFVDGAPVAIRSFARSGGTPAVAGATEPGRGPAASSDRPDASSDRTVLYLDDFFLSPVSRKKAVEELRKFLRDSLPDGAEVSLVTFDRKGLTVRVPFTTLRSRVGTALAQLPVESVEGFRRDADRESVVGSIRDAQISRLSAQKDAGVGVDGGTRSEALEFQPPCGIDLLEWARAYAAQESADAERSLHALRLFLDSLAPLPGRKTLIHVSDGIPLRGGSEAFGLLRALCDGSGARQGLAGAIEVIAGEGAAGAEGASATSGLRRGDRIESSTLATVEREYDALSTLREVTSRANTQGTTLYTLQAVGLGAAQGNATRDFRTTTPEIESAARVNRQDTLSALAVDTGGAAFFDRDDLAAALATVSRDRDRSYSLAFEPPLSADQRGARGGNGGAKIHTVRLETERAGLSLRYRKSYLDEKASADAGARMMAALFHGATENPLGLALDLRPAPADPKGGAAAAEPDERWVARLTVPVANLVVLPDGSGALRNGVLAVHMVMQDNVGISPLRRKEVPVRLPPAATAPTEPPYVYEVRFVKPAGKVVVVIALEDILGKKVAVVRKEIG